MTKLFNRRQELEKRRELRKNQTLAEKAIWNQLRNRQFLGLKFRRQYSIGEYIVDFYCSEYKIALEVDGSIHKLKGQKEYDKYRQYKMESYGIRFIRITNKEYFSNPNKAFNKIEVAVKGLINLDR
jgi:very-short-patch-repair endonuclease